MKTGQSWRSSPPPEKPGILERPVVAVVAVLVALLSSVAVGTSSVGAEATGGGQLAAGFRSVGAAPALPTGAQAVGTVPAAEPIHFDVVLQPRDPAALSSYATAVSTPGSTSYRHFLTVSDFAATFGASPAAVKDVTRALLSDGLSVGPLSANHLLLPVTASVGQASASLSTRFERYHLSTGRIAEANTSAPKLPAAAVPYVQAVVGLNDLLTAPAGPPRALGTPAPGAATAAQSAAGPQACSAASSEATSSGGWTDPQLASAYSISGLYKAGDLGAGTTVALFELDQFSASDIASFQSCFNTHVPITNVAVDGGDGTGSGAGEATLDIETVIGLAPQSNLLVYDAPQANYAKSSLDEYTKIIDDNKAQVLSASYGLCEQTLKLVAPGLQASENVLFEQAAVQGMSVFASTGDTGAEACYPNGGALEVAAGTKPDAVAVDSATGTSYVANRGSGTLSVVSDTQLKVVATVSLGTTTDPAAVAVDPTHNLIFVAEPGTGTLSEIKGATCDAKVTSGCSTAPTTVAGAPTAGQPNGVAVDPGTGTVYATDEFSDEVAVFRESPLAVVAVSPTGGDLPIGVAVDTATDEVYVANSSLLSDSVAQIDGATCNASTTSGCSAVPPAVAVGSGPSAVAIDPGPGLVLAANQFGESLSILNATTGQTVATVALSAFGTSPQSVSLSPSGKEALVAMPAGGSGIGKPAVVVVNLTTDTVTGVIEKGAGAIPEAVASDTTNGLGVVADAGGGVAFVPMFAAVLDAAAQPFVTAVGGTDLKALGPAPTETTWNEAVNPTCDCQEGAGTGGISTTFPMPSWQSGPGVISTDSSGSPCKATTGDCREVPDVSASADPVNGYVIFDNGAWTSIGGTSAATPLWAAMVADIESARSPSVRLGLVSPDLYQLAAEGHHDFNDVTVGTNDYLGTTGGLFPATAHYDMATGLGSPIATALANNLLPPAVTSVSPVAGPTSGGTTLTVTGTNLTGATKVVFGSIAGTGVKVDSSTELTVVTPVHAAGKYNVSVVTPQGKSPPVAGDLFTFDGPPGVTAVSPTSGPEAGGTTVTVTGTNLTGATKVVFGSIAGTGVKVDSSTKLTVVTPAHATGKYNISVVTPGGKSPFVTGDLFTFH